MKKITVFVVVFLAIGVWLTTSNALAQRKMMKKAMTAKVIQQINDASKKKAMRHCSESSVIDFLLIGRSNFSRDKGVPLTLRTNSLHNNTNCATVLNKLNSLNVWHL